METEVTGYSSGLEADKNRFCEEEKKKSRLPENKILLKGKICCSNPVIICCDE